MAVSFVGATSGNSGAGTATSFAVTLPVGWQAGDAAVLTGHLRGGSLTMATPSGWTPLPGPAWPVAQGSNSRAYGWFRVLQAGDVAPLVTNSGAATGGWSMTAFRGARPGSPIEQVGTSAASGVVLALPTMAGVVAGSALAVATHAGVSTGVVPAALAIDGPLYTKVVDHVTSRATTNANQRMAAGYRLIDVAGPYGGEQITSDVTASLISILAVIAPGVESGTMRPASRARAQATGVSRDTARAVGGARGTSSMGGGG